MNPPGSTKKNPSGHTAKELIANMEQITWERTGPMSLENARRNVKFLDRGESLAALREVPVGEGDHAIIVASGPSIKFKDPAKAIQSSGYKGAIICAESAIRYLLTHGIIPDLMVTVDPHPHRIVRWLGDPDLNEEKLAKDDYFRRQDMDEQFARELEVNQKIIDLLGEHGREIRIALSTSSSEVLVNRVLEIGMQIYWWNPMLDDPDTENSVTRELHEINGLPCVNAGGNVGAAAFMMADAVLEKKHVGLVGMDLSYYDDTPYRNTQYYDAMLKVADEEDLDQFFIRIHNPHIDQWFFTDPAYMWYCESFMEIAQDADCMIYNCTEGGILFGDPIEFIPFQRFLEKFSP